MRTRSFRVRPADDDELLAVEPFGFAPQAAVSWRVTSSTPASSVLRAWSLRRSTGTPIGTNAEARLELPAIGPPRTHRRRSHRSNLTFFLRSQSVQIWWQSATNAPDGRVGDHDSISRVALLFGPRNSCLTCAFCTRKRDYYGFRTFINLSFHNGATCKIV
jgi:hypothetical protein